MKQRINSFCQWLCNFTPFLPEPNPNSFVNTPIGYKTTMPIDGVTMDEWESGEWIKLIGKLKNTK